MSSQKEIELILARQLASYLVMPIFIVDPPGNLIYYNEPAEIILGRRFEETGEMPIAEWSTLFKPTDETGEPLAPESLPLVIALTHHRPAHREMWIQGLDGVRRLIEVTAFPIDGQAERRLGAIAIFWEVKS
ncbi:MAG TPA: PAS domain-containing protein [Anaerolineales bacterium]|nr:PAS domain-containing protein [Anaerolineales bacterium]